MGSTVFDSAIFGGLFGTGEMRAVFSDQALINHYLEVEAALARAQARAGVIPQADAEAIDAASRAIAIDVDRLGRETAIVGYPILPLVRRLAEAAGEAGRHVHWGATTQDVMDTASVLQVRAALAIVDRDLKELRAILSDMARRHRDTPMAGRTHLQQATPITFGHKAAVWLSSVDRHVERVAQVAPRVLVGQLSGAAGTLAAMGERGMEVQRLFCEELGLGRPVATWHVARDGLAETVTLLGLITGTLGKIATDIMLMSATEIGEVSEPFVEGRGASSTMPQKRNPIASELILAAAKAVRQHVAAMLDAMIHDFERATGPWQLEWIALPEAFLLTGSALSHTRSTLVGLIVREDRMLKNLATSRGLIAAEAVMMAIAPHVGRQNAHDLIYAACHAAIERRRPLGDILLDTPAITRILSAAEIARHCDPANHIGLSARMVDRALGIIDPIP